MRGLVGLVAALAAFGCGAERVAPHNAEPAAVGDGVEARGPAVARGTAAGARDDVDGDTARTPSALEGERLPNASDATSQATRLADDPPRRLQPSVATREELIERLRPHLSRSIQGLTAKRHPDGSVSYDTEGRFQHAMLVTRGPDGRASYGCVESVEGAQQLLGLRGSKAP